MKLINVLRNKVSVGLMSMVAMMAMSTACFAAETGPTVDTTQVNSTFSSIATTVLLVIGSVAATAVVIMGTILAWKYGRKLFGMLAK